MARSTASCQRLRPVSIGIPLLFLCANVHPPHLLIAQGTAQSSTPEDSVRAVESARADALLRADTAALSRMVADEFIEISRLGQLRTKADNIHDIGSGELRLRSVRYDSLGVRIYGEVAVLSGIADNAGTFRGFPFSGKIRYLRVFIRRGGRWQAVAMQHTAIQ